MVLLTLGAFAGMVIGATGEDICSLPPLEDGFDFQCPLHFQKFTFDADQGTAFTFISHLFRKSKALFKSTNTF